MTAGLPAAYAAGTRRKPLGRRLPKPPPLVPTEGPRGSHRVAPMTPKGKAFRTATPNLRSQAPLWPRYQYPRKVLSDARLDANSTIIPPHELSTNSTPLRGYRLPRVSVDSPPRKGSIPISTHSRPNIDYVMKVHGLDRTPLLIPNISYKMNTDKKASLQSADNRHQHDSVV